MSGVRVWPIVERVVPQQRQFVVQLTGSTLEALSYEAQCHEMKLDAFLGTLLRMATETISEVHSEFADEGKDNSLSGDA